MQDPDAESAPRELRRGMGAAAPAAHDPGVGCVPEGETSAAGGKWRLAWSAGIGGLLVVFLVPGLVRFSTRPPDQLLLILGLAATAGVAAVFLRLVRKRMAEDGEHARPIPWFELGTLLALVTGLAALGTPWAQAFALATFVVGLYLSAVVAAAAVVVLSAMAGTFGLLGGGDLAAAMTLTFAATIMGGFGYLTNRSMALSAQLRTSERELARMAAADERLRIARELHDLMGHSLSLITLKAELARTLLPGGADRPRQEIKDIETVARNSLDDVRNAVTGYREPDLAAELAQARHTTAAAGIDCREHTPQEWSLPAEVDSLLAWSVREATTNLVRHSKARTCTIRLDTAATATLEVTDDGVGPRSAEAGSGGAGLTGLAERVGLLGGSLDVGTAGKHGFRLRVRVPVDGAE